MSLADKPAYPVTIWDKETNKGTPTYGMTLRQYYAGLNMMGLLANKELPYDTDIPYLAVKFTDDLIKELEKEK